MATNNNSGRDGQVQTARKLLVLLEALSVEGAYVSRAEVERRLSVTSDEAKCLMYLLLSLDRGDRRPLPLTSDDNLSYLVAQGPLSPSLFERRPALTHTEATALAGALFALKTPDNSPLQKLLASPVVSSGDLHPFIKQIVQEKVSTEEQENLLVCSNALAGQRNLRFTYFPAEKSLAQEASTPQKRFVAPLYIACDTTGWKLDAFDFDKQQQRTFFMRGMREVETIPATFNEMKRAKSTSSAAEQSMVTLFFNDEKYLSLFDWKDLSVIENNLPGGVIKATIPFFKTEWLPRHILACDGHVWTDDPELIHLLKDFVRKRLDT